MSNVLKEKNKTFTAVPNSRASQPYSRAVAERVAVEGAIAEKEIADRAVAGSLSQPAEQQNGKIVTGSIR